uniref:Uncharacterized protein n=1 Tax=Ditylenchus dipsaci TaxID=166011 RepID=A0A915CWF2_9BILA
MDSSQVSVAADLVKAHCSKSLGSASQKSQSKSEPKQGVTCNIDDKVVPSSFSLPKENAPTFLLNTSRGSHSPPLLDVDKPCMYFGFRQLQYESMDVLNLNGLVDCGLIIRCRLKPLKNEAFRILYKADTKQKIKAFGTHSVYISFCPRLAVRYKATLHIDCLSQKNESAEYTCQLLGFGGQAMVHPFLNPVSIKSRRDLVMSAGGRFNLIPKSINKFSFMLENKGTRDAFASVILQDVNGDEIPTENAFVQPANLLLDKSSQSSKKIEVRMFVQNAIGSRRNSFASNASSRISSAVNNTTGSALPTAFRILVLWGEERQRQRLKMLERRKREKFFFLNRHFTVTRYEAEQANWDDATDELLSKEDYRMFEGYLRVTVIEVLDKRYSRSIQENAFKSRPASATGNTVIELEPDNTNNFGRDSILSSILE